ncbi:MAG: bifunctional UDP-N-acetylglucosamine diphosphorylase/glucosamine-1-phosphate N-acetyltransferase GlmU [Coriobacteriia bacterium]|nr:bifunctional UDP-N-acetylglucosamine diphosphorylase/glucosamine-1-phosphate N-acetyltransferase GlmU [Coriobacteriia bacterium]
MGASALILAAGEGTRMRSRLPKVMHEILGVPMVRYVVEAARAAGCDPVVVVTGHGAEVVEAALPDVATVRQEVQLGTGHAVQCAQQAFEGFDGSLLVLSGDSPLISADTLRALVEEREAAGASAAVLTAVPDDPRGYGRIVRDDAGRLVQIVEERDAPEEIRAVREVNTGFYCFDAQTLFAHLHALDNANAQGEFYLTDVVDVFRREGLAVVTATARDAREAAGVNNRVQLAEAAKVLQRRINERHMLAGVTMNDPDLVWIGPSVTLGRDVTLAPMTFLLGETSVADGCVIGPDARVVDSVVGPDAVIDSSIVVESCVCEGASVGPRAYLRPGTVVRPNAKVGTSVEVKNSIIGEGSKVPHLSYIGDAEIGVGVNVGAGTITCNYDGRSKHKTVVEDGAFIGSDTMLVAPVRIGAGAITGAGSAITRDVPADALAVERAEQRIVEGWARRRREQDEEE